MSTRSSVTRFRGTKGFPGWFGLRIVCEHGAQAELIYPLKSTIESWERSARHRPCDWVPGCPVYPWPKEQ